MNKISSGPELFQLHAQVCQALGDAKRLMIIHALRDGERGVGELAASLGLAQPTVSQHLAVLRERGLVVPRREGNHTYYRLASPKIALACDLMREVMLERMAYAQALRQSAG